MEHKNKFLIAKSGFRCVKSGFPTFQSNETGRKQISTLRNPSLEWISIKKSKSGFPFYRSIGKSEKGFEKLFSWTMVFSLLIMRTSARPLFLRTVFLILLRVSQSNGKRKSWFGFLNWNPLYGWISQSWNPFSDFVFNWKSEVRIFSSIKI